MTTVLLIFPFFRPRHDHSEFRFPPLGLAYLAASLRKAGHRVTLLDCSFLGRREAFSRASSAEAAVVGIYSMIGMKSDSLLFAQALRPAAGLLVAGGPLPTADPGAFLGDFDLVAVGEGEATMCDIVSAFESGGGFEDIPGIAMWPAGDPSRSPVPYRSIDRPLVADLDSLPIPARDLLPNRSYIAEDLRRHRRAVTTIMSTRGCPFECEFCSNAVFGKSYRERSAEGVADEIEDALSYGYDRIHFGDDVFTLKRDRLLALCAEIERRGLRFSWECLGRVDSIDAEAARAMRAAGCDRIFFGIESGSERILGLMRKKITPDQAAGAVEAARSQGIRTGAFFILFYPGDDDESVLQTLRFAASLPLDYLSFSLPHPIPGTALYKRVEARRNQGVAGQPGIGERLRCRGDFSEAKMKLGLRKGKMEHWLSGRVGAATLRLIFSATDELLRRLR